MVRSHGTCSDELGDQEDRRGGQGKEWHCAKPSMLPPDGNLQGHAGNPSSAWLTGSRAATRKDSLGSAAQPAALLADVHFGGDPEAGIVANVRHVVGACPGCAKRCQLPLRDDRRGALFHRDRPSQYSGLVSHCTSAHESASERPGWRQSDDLRRGWVGVWSGGIGRQMGGGPAAAAESLGRRPVLG